MAKQMSVMMFGKYKGMQIEDVPTNYLIWVFGSFPKLRNKLRGVLAERGLSRKQITTQSSQHRVLSMEPESDEVRLKKLMKPRKVRRTDEQKRANEVARKMGHPMPYPRYQPPRAWAYFKGKGGR